MSAHDHKTLVGGCYRCELNKDEMRGANTVSDIDHCASTHPDHAYDHAAIRRLRAEADRYRKALEAACELLARSSEWIDLVDGRCAMTSARSWMRASLR